MPGIELDQSFFVHLLSSTIRMSSLVLLPALGEIYCERSGVLNIALEGQMLIGAITGFASAFCLGNPWLGLLIGSAAGLVFSLLHGLFCITLRSPQVIVGIILNLLAAGLSSFVYRILFGTIFIPPYVRSLDPFPIPLFSKIPFLGAAIFQQKPTVYLTFLFVPIASFILFHTPFGLKIRAVGEHPLAAETSGVKVNMIRYICVLFTGVTSGLAGAMLSVTELSRFTDNMTAGRGFIALAIVIFSRWSPYRAMVAALLFGFVDALQMMLQAAGSSVPSQLLLMLPYLATVLVIVVARKSPPPAKLGEAYTKGEE